MRILSIRATDTPPIRCFEASELGDIVIFAGANGSGKTRLKDAIINAFRTPKSPKVEMTIRSTRPDQEAATWGMEEIVLKPNDRSNVLHQYMHSRTRGGTYTGSVIHIDSNRSVSPISFQQISLATPDPDDVDIEYTYFLSPFVGRWQDLVNKIFQKVANRDYKIAEYVKSHPEGTSAEALKQYPDSFLQYQSVFERLLPGKQLDPIDPKQPREFHYRIGNSDPLPFNTLSSGEQEVVKIAFDLIWKRIRHCVIVVDEPELHLHPTLTFRLIETLKAIGAGTNQFLLFTHSADLISTYYSSGNVYFIDTDTKQANQARRLSALDDNHVETARALGNNLGLFAVGKKLVFVEGREASIDRLVYHRIGQAVFSDAYILPTGSVGSLLTLSQLSEELQRSIFGIDFFMVRDRDGLGDDQASQLELNPRFRCLRRRHVENYFLDGELIANISKSFYLNARWHSGEAVENELKEIASGALDQAALLALKQFVTLNGTVDAPRIRDLQKKESSEIVAQFSDMIDASISEVCSLCNKQALAEQYEKYRNELKLSLTDGTWKSLFPGKYVLSVFCSKAATSVTQLRQAYVDRALTEKPSVFEDIAGIFQHFKSIQ